MTNFTNKDTIVLSPKQEVEIFNLLTTDEVFQLSSGSSRIAFCASAKTLIDILGFGEEIFTDEVVIKLSIGVGGCNQSRNEINAWNKYGDGTTPLAPIYAYGQFIEVMPRLSNTNICAGILDCCSNGYAYICEDDLDTLYMIATYFFYESGMTRSDFANAYDAFDAYAEANGLEKDVSIYNVHNWDELAYKLIDFTEREFIADATERSFLVDKAVKLTKEVLNRIRQVDDLLGETTDNQQFGCYEEDDSTYLCYDYGFLGDVDCNSWTWCSNITDTAVDDPKWLKEYLDSVSELLSDRCTLPFEQSKLEDIESRIYDAAHGF